MIAGTPYAPGKAFMDAALAMLAGLAAGDFQAAFGAVDANDDGSRWSRSDFDALLKRHTSGPVASPFGIGNSARPNLIAIEPDSVYELRHAIPVGNRWSDSCVVLRFARKPGTQFYRMQFLGIEGT